MATTKKKAGRKKRTEKIETPSKKERKKKLTPLRDINAPPDEQGMREIENEVYDGMPAAMADLKNKPVDITDVMPAGLVELLNNIGDMSAADGYFLGTIGAKMINCISPLEMAHLSSLIGPLIDKLHKDRS